MHPPSESACIRQCRCATQSASCPGGSGEGTRWKWHEDSYVVRQNWLRATYLAREGIHVAAAHLLRVPEHLPRAVLNLFQPRTERLPPLRSRCKPKMRMNEASRPASACSTPSTRGTRVSHLQARQKIRRGELAGLPVQHPRLHGRPQRVWLGHRVSAAREHTRGYTGRKMYMCSHTLCFMCEEGGGYEVERDIQEARER